MSNSNPPEQPDLVSQLEGIIDRHTLEWKAGHNHLIVEQVLSAIKEALEEMIGEDEPMTEGRLFEQKVEDLYIHSRNELRATQRAEMERRLSEK